MVRALKRKIQRSLALRGVLGSIRHGGSVSLDRLLELLPSRKQARDSERAHDSEFDRRFGVKTSGPIPSSDLDVKNGNWRHGSAYVATSPVDFGALLKDQQLPYERLLFIDFGSGKGRVLLMASELPFKKIIGVEYSAELNQIAERNTRTYRNAKQQCKDIVIVQGDVVDFPIPDEPLVLFFYHPFDREIMARVAENVRASYRANPRRIVVIYFKPVHADVWDGVGFLKLVYQTEYRWIYDTGA
jgi:SAM-dependent methyltransferase